MPLSSTHATTAHTRPKRSRLGYAIALTTGLLLMSASGVAAADPTGTVAANGSRVANGQPANDRTLSVLTSEDQLIVADKLATADGIRAAAASGDAFAIQAASSDSLSTYARQQSNGYYCGPTSGQVVSNFSWGINKSSTGGTTTANNKFTQITIASWMNTTTAGTTGANLAGTYNANWNLRSGLNKASRLPSGFGYYYTATGTGAQWHSKVITDVNTWNMPLVVPVKPHDPGSLYRLTSWPNAVQAWHWIAVRGYNGAWNGTRTPLVYYNDSSAGYSGGTGSYSDPSLDVHYLNARNSGNLVW